MSRTTSALAALGISALFTVVTACGNSDIPLSEAQVVEATIDELGDLMSSGRLTSRRLTEIYLARIERYDRRGPRLNSLLEVNWDALAIADSLDRERRENGPRSPLHGIPVILKDAMATADQLRTSNGSYLLMDAVVTQDATVAHKLRESGALILAKANMDEMACCNGVFSGRGGGVRNPYDLDRFASGSSSGSAVSVAANLAVISLGGDTRSSIRFPASVTSLVGLKPTMGLISRAGVIPADVHLDVVGPMARTVTDVAIVTGLLAGFDQRDPYTLAGADHALVNYRPFLRRDALEGARIGVARQGFFGFSPAIDSVTEEALRALERGGAILVDSLTIEAIPYAGGREEDAKVLRASASWALNQYLMSLSFDSPIRSLAQLRAAAWLGRYPTNFAPGFAREFAVDTVGWNPADYPVDRPEVTEAFERFISEQRDQVMAVLDAEELSAIVFPTTSRLTRLLIPTVQPGEPPSRSRGQPEIANYSGLPELTVPAGYTGSGFPVGLSFLGRAFSEGDLFGLAFAFEQATHHRREPDLNKVPSAVDPTLPEPPSNDAFAERSHLAGASGSVSGNHLLATVEIDEPRFNAQPIDRTVWFTYTAVQDGNLIIDDAGSAPVRNDIVVYTGASLDWLERVSLSRRNSDLDAAEVSVPVRDGTTYLIVVGTDTYRVAGGHFFLNWRVEPSR